MEERERERERQEAPLALRPPHGHTQSYTGGGGQGHTQGYITGGGVQEAGADSLPTRSELFTHVSRVTIFHEREMMSINVSGEMVILKTGLSSSFLVAGGCSARVGVPHRPLLPALPTWLGADMAWG